LMAKIYGPIPRGARSAPEAAHCGTERKHTIIDYRRRWFDKQIKNDAVDRRAFKLPRRRRC
jgi:hypothetical protein